MRTYYVLAADPKRSDLQSVTTYELGDVDLTPLWKGEPATDTLRSGWRLFVSSKLQPDLLGNPLNLMIVSDRVLAVMQRFVPEEDLQVISLPIFNLTTKEAVSGFSLINPLRMIKALSPDSGDGRPMVDRLMIKDSLVPRDVHLFRLAERPICLLISQELFHGLAGQGFQGLMAIHTRTVA